jgi:tetratricopeptide (TPR) repeat protein
VAEALGYIDEVDAIEDDLITETKDLDFNVGAEQFQVEVSSIQDQLQDATVKLDAAASSLQKIDRPSLPDWWDTYISLLDNAYDEKRQAYEEWGEFITRMAEMAEFNQAYQALVVSYTAALDTLTQAINQHDAGGWAAAKNTCNTALTQLAEARTHLDRASQLEPSVDLSQVSAAITQVETFIPEFQRLCDLANAGAWDEHNTLIDQLKPRFDTLPRDISFDIVSWIAADRDRYVASIEDHLEKEAEYRRRAAEVWDQNNP